MPYPMLKLHDGLDGYRIIMWKPFTLGFGRQIFDTVEVLRTKTILNYGTWNFSLLFPISRAKNLYILEFTGVLLLLFHKGRSYFNQLLCILVGPFQSGNFRPLL